MNFKKFVELRTGKVMLEGCLRDNNETKSLKTATEEIEEGKMGIANSETFCKKLTKRLVCPSTYINYEHLFNTQANKTITDKQRI